MFNLVFYFSWKLLLPEQVVLRNSLFLQQSWFFHIVNNKLADYMSFADSLNGQIGGGCQYNQLYGFLPEPRLFWRVCSLYKWA